jgi:hypothetical protein
VIHVEVGTVKSDRRPDPNAPAALPYEE